ncbi:unnamed protein product [Effrenium voratum]|uniref:Uncharacterized protein n=1 Tax=Effrenium voratum TaxID=2562239 RepID=A0AA36J0Y2_9DINO|nr:unnamed protein product [Effrenium voratum]
MSEDDEDVEQSAEEKQLEAEIKAIELDISLIDLRRELEAQEELLARWEESVLQLKDERREAETYHLHGAEDRKQERELQAELQQAQESVALLRQRVEQLEALKASSAA